jgi:hypothetical protein
MSFIVRFVTAAHFSTTCTTLRAKSVCVFDRLEISVI